MLRVFTWAAFLTCAAFLFVLPISLEGQARLPSPRGEAHTQIGGRYNADGQYQGGWWIVVDYGRPILRGRRNMPQSAGESVRDLDSLHETLRLKRVVRIHFGKEVSAKRPPRT